MYSNLIDIIYHVIIPKRIGLKEYLVNGAGKRTSNEPGKFLNTHRQKQAMKDIIPDFGRPKDLYGNK